jgi:hypothetical protein
MSMFQASSSQSSQRVPKRPIGLPTAFLVGLLVLLLAGVGRAQEPPNQKDEDTQRALGHIKRIEISVFGGYFAGLKFLSLPPLAPDTTDLGSSEILDFDGDALTQPKYPGQIDAVEKKVQNGVFAGASATFYMTDAFGLELIGAYGRTKAKITGQYLDPSSVDQNHPKFDPSQLDGRFEWDSSDMNWIQGGVNMVYVFGKRTLRPYLLLGFGGVLNSFPNADSVGALYFEYGGGFRYELREGLALRLGLSSSLFSWSQKEVDLNRSVQYPMVSFGVIWKHIVPPEVYQDGDEGNPEETSEAQGSASGI